MKKQRGFKIEYDWTKLISYNQNHNLGIMQKRCCYVVGFFDSETNFVKLTTKKAPLTTKISQKH